MLLDLGDDVDFLDAGLGLGHDAHRVVDLRESAGELDVDDGPMTWTTFPVRAIRSIPSLAFLTSLTRPRPLR
jgi:hypothetical protein